MARIGPKDTKPEILLRRGLHRAGFRYSLHRRDLPGKPDIVLPKWRAVIFVNGCYWHGHEGCMHFRLPKGNAEFWAAKIGRTQARDLENIESCQTLGWRVLTVWECTMRGRTALEPDILIDEVGRWLTSGEERGVVEGVQPS